MIKKLTLVRPALFAALLCGVSAATVLAQDAPPPPMHHGPPPMPLFDALDTNHDGTISAEEIANASTSLKSLLKNGSDHLTREDLRPAGAPPPPPPSGAPGGPAADDHAGPPRPKIGGIRPHNPPPRAQEDAPEPDAHHPRPHGPGGEQAREDFDRPRFDREDRREDRREWQRPPRMHEEDVADEHPFPRRERMARRQGPPHPGADEMDRDEHPAHHGPPPTPLFDALDANHDGTISADEIANASTVLKSLLKNGSDHLTRDDLRPAGDHPPMDH